MQKRYCMISLIFVILCSVAWSYLILCDPVDCSPPGSSVHEFSKQEFWIGVHFLLQGVFLTQGLNPQILRLLHWQVDSLPLVPPGKPHF